MADAKVQLLTMRLGGAIYHYRSQQQEARGLLAKALAMADELVDSTTQRMVLSYLVRATYFLGEYSASLQYAKRLFALVRSMTDAFWHSFAAITVGHAHLRCGELMEAAAYLVHGQTHSQQALSSLLLSSQAQYLVMAGQNAEAKQRLADALSSLEREPINPMAEVAFYRMPAEVALLLWERAETSGERQSAAVLSRRALRVLWRFALRSPHGWAALCLLQGRAAFLQEDFKRAAFLLARVHRLAERYQMRPIAALAQCWLGRVRADPVGRRMIAAGIEQLRQFGARWDVDTINHWPASPPFDSTVAAT
jgi:hypothetical protein